MHKITYDLQIQICINDNLFVFALKFLNIRKSMSSVSYLNYWNI